MNELWRVWQSLELPVGRGTRMRSTEERGSVSFHQFPEEGSGPLKG